MMNSSKPEKNKKVEDNIIKDIKNLFRLRSENKKRTKKELDYTAIKDIRNLFRLKKENKTNKDGIIRDIRNLSGIDWYKPLRVGSFEVMIILNIKVIKLLVN